MTPLNNQALIISSSALALGLKPGWWKEEKWMAEAKTCTFGSQWWSCDHWYSNPIATMCALISSHRYLRYHQPHWHRCGQADLYPWQVKPAGATTIISQHQPNYITVLGVYIIMPPVQSHGRKICWCHPGCGILLSSLQWKCHYRKAVHVGLQGDGMHDSSEGSGDSKSDLVEG